jgi:hypothetical protein
MLNINHHIHCLLHQQLPLRQGYVDVKINIQSL